MPDLLGLALWLLLAWSSGPAPGLGAVFHPRERAVDNWRRQAALNLDTSPGIRVDLLLGRNPAAVPRCVRLNNYWCIKRGGWSGEIAADGEGHVAFASAAEGAAVAALLLRRYYVDNGLHSATAIVRRWAPATCGNPTPRGATRRGVPPHRGAPDGLSRRGIGGTLRARWLAARGGRRATLGRLRGRASAVPDPLIGAPGSSPTITLGLGAAPVSLAASLPEVLASRPAAPLPPPPRACPGDEEARVAAYARRAASGIVASPDADLALFDAAGRPTPHLARAMRNMAAVEIGPLGAATDLVETAVGRVAAMVAARRPPSAAAPGRIDEARRPEPRP